MRLGPCLPEGWLVLLAGLGALGSGGHPAGAAERGRRPLREKVRE